MEKKKDLIGKQIYSHTALVSTVNHQNVVVQFSASADFFWEPN